MSTDRVLLEVCAESLDYAMAAERGGADRIELSSALALGGITPGVETMEAAREALGVPVHILVRPRAGDFVYSGTEFETMRNDIEVVKRLRFDGVVTGVLDREGAIDVERTGELVELAWPLEVTFHRAFDECPDFAQALEQAIKTGARRILTCGSRTQRAADGLDGLRSLVKAAAGRIQIMPGGGIRANNLLRIVKGTGAREVHSSAGALEVTNSGCATRSDAVFESRVQELAKLLDELAAQS
ncbi:MAG TPA: copper homeostasis protein CutC [Candidatus Cybelea sp.]|nr:copper homeostasis protein CutC [Candidatus Cybelea sp.]